MFNNVIQTKMKTKTKTYQVMFNDHGEVLFLNNNWYKDIDSTVTGELMNAQTYTRRGDAERGLLRYLGYYSGDDARYLMNHSQIVKADVAINMNTTIPFSNRKGKLAVANV